MRNWNWTKNDHHHNGRSQRGKQEVAASPAAMPYLGQFSDMYRDMDRMFERAYRNFGMGSLFGGAMMPGMMFTPSVDIASSDKEYIIEMEVPGMSEQDIRLDLTRDGDLCICGEKRQENGQQEKDFHYVERAYGSFSRTLSLPDDIDRDNIDAHFNNGVLTITAPRLEGQNSQSRRIEVKSGENGRGKRERQASAAQENVHQHKRAS